MTSDPGERARLDRLRIAAERLFGPLDDESLRDIADHVEWLGCAGGQCLMRQGEIGDCAYLVLGGRLRAVRDDAAGHRQVLGDIAAGESVGEVALITGEPRTATVIAIRDSVLVCIKEQSFEGMIRRHPGLALGLTRIVMRRQERILRGDRPRPRVDSAAVLFTGDRVPRAEFVTRLKSALEPHGSVRILDATALRDAALGDDELAIRAWLDQQEDRHRFVVYVADPDPGSDPGSAGWARRCLRQADRVLVVTHRDDPPRPHGFERDHLANAPVLGTEADLVIVHPDGASPPHDTASRLEPRPVKTVHHVRWDRDGDMARLGRFVSGAAIGLVLAGGGAKGLAHVGVIRALRERGIPIDAVGGTSIGAVTAASVALDWDQDRLERAHRNGFADRNPMNDYAVPPIVSLFKGRRIDRMLQRYFGDVDIEDAWLPYFAVSSNLTAASPCVHRTGTLRRAARASLAIPGVLPPVVYGNDLHIDGGMFDNLPVEPMQVLGAGRIIAVDLAVQRKFDLAYDEVPSIRELLVDRYVTRRRRLKVPGLTGTVLRATILASLEKSARNRSAADLLLEPPVERIGMLSWRKFDRAVDLGYSHTVDRLDTDPDVLARLLGPAAPAP